MKGRLQDSCLDEMLTKSRDYGGVFGERKIVAEKERLRA